jgi:hypothetical protein
MLLPSMTVPAVVTGFGPVYAVRVIPDGIPVLLASGKLLDGGMLVVIVGVEVDVGVGVGYILARKDSMVVICARLHVALTGVHVALVNTGSEVEAPVGNTNAKIPTIAARTATTEITKARLISLKPPEYTVSIE